MWLRRLGACGAGLAMLLGAASCSAPKPAANLEDFKAGKALEEKGDYSAAIARLNTALAHGDLPVNVEAEALYDRGFSYVQNGQAAKGIADYTEVIRLEPTWAGPFADRASAYEGLRQFDQVIFDDTASLQIDPSSAQVHVSRATAYRRTGLFDLATADDQAAVSADPKNVLAHRGLGRDDLHAGKISDALAEFNEAIALQPQEIDRYLDRSDLYLQQGNFAQALGDRATAVGMDPRNASLLLDRGIARFMLSRYAEALEDFEAARSSDASYAYAAIWAQLARLRLGQSGDGPLSAAAGKVDLATWPGPVIRLMLGTMTPDQVMAAAPTSPPADAYGQKCEAVFYIGEMGLARGANPAARDLIKQATTNCPDDYYEYSAAKAELIRLH